MSDFGKVEIARLSFLISCTRGPPYAWLQPTFRRTGLAPGHPDELVPPTIHRGRRLHRASSCQTVRSVCRLRQTHGPSGSVSLTVRD